MPIKNEHMHTPIEDNCKQNKKNQMGKTILIQNINYM